MSSLNQCNFIGRLCKDPETRFTPSGTAICNFTIAVSEKRKGEEITEWVKVIAFDRLAEIAQRYTQKGSLVFVSGKLQTQKWQDKEGVDRYTTQIIANQLQMLGGKENKQESPTKQFYDQSSASDDFSDIPF